LIRSVPLLMADRLALGAVEGVVLPAMLIYLTRWFTKPERSRSNALLILANPITMATASVLCGFLIHYFDRHPFGQLRGWQMMFIIEGLPSALWAFGWLILAAEKPTDAGWLGPDEAAAIQERLDHEQRGIVHIHDYWAAFSDPRVIMLAIAFMGLNAASYGLMMWLPQIVEEGSHANPALAGLLTSLPYALAVFSMVAVAWASDRSLRRKRFVAGSMWIGCLAFCLAWYAGTRHWTWLAFAGLMVVGSMIYTPVAPLWAWMAEMLPRNVIGESMALVNSFGALGGFTGTLTVGYLKNHFHSSGAAFLFQACCFAVAGVMAGAVRAKAPEPIAAMEI
jgi:sugar phosphate permease